MSTPTLTTAVVLGSLRRELIAEGIPEYLADDLVRNAARELAETGVNIKNPADPAQAVKP